MNQARIDAHQHFWQYHPTQHAWINEDMAAIKRDFLPDDLALHLQQLDFEGCVSVQVDQTETENAYMLAFAEQFDFIKGIVGWVDLQSDHLEERLHYYQQFPKLKGFRHILQGEAQRDFMLRPAFMRGISKLKDFNYTYDILIFPDQLPYALEFIKTFPDQAFVIDHIAKPLIKKGIIDDWKYYMMQIATYDNVYCKISGLVTEADWQHWKPEDFKPYLDVVVQAFGTDRIFYGSDYPVCTLAASYEEVYNIVKDYFSTFSASEQSKFFGENAIRFYNL